MSKVGIVITDGVGYRNFLLSDFLKEAQLEFSKVVILSCLPIEAYASLNLKCEIVEIEEFQETFAGWFFRKAKEVAHLQLHSKNNFGIKSNLKKNYSHSNSPRGLATRFIFLFTKFFNSERCIQFFYVLQQLTFKNSKTTKEYISILKNYTFDLVFFTHQRPPFIAPLIYASKKMQIKSATFIFSWDNLASKGRMAGNFDYYLVWSELMKKELLHFYSRISSHQIEVVGTPQFEPYVMNDYQLDYKRFSSLFSLNKPLPVVLYSCGDVSTSPNDNHYIALIAEAILSRKIEKEVHLIVRVSPAEDGSRFNHLVEKYPFIIWNYPKWNLSRSAHQETWSQRVPTIEDVLILKALLKYCHVSINMLSTMSLDAMLFDKPVINPVFGNGKNGLGDDQKFLTYEHIKRVLKTEATTLVKDEKELIEAINFTLTNPKIKQIEQQQLLDLQIGKPLEGTSKRIVKSMANFIKK